MRFGKLDLNLLIALDHILHLRSITKAADRMNLTQSAMSSALRRLRDYFGDPLLVQVGRRMELTPRAESLKQPVRHIIVQIDAALSTGLDFDAAESDRVFRFILSDFTMAVFMPHLLAIAAEEGARVRFQLLPQVKSPSEVIERGDADFLITPRVLISPDHPSELLFHDTFVALVWSESPLAHQPLTRERYLAAKHVVVVPTGNIPATQSDLMFKMGVVRDSEVECYSFLGVAALVLGTDRIATVHGQIARSLVKAYPLAIHPLPFPDVNIQEHLQWHRYMSDDPAIAWIRGLAQRAALRLAQVSSKSMPGMENFAFSTSPSPRMPTNSSP